MSIEKAESTVSDYAYQVVEATNEDGTINGKIVEPPEKDGDKLVLKVFPKIPDADTKEFRLNCPTRDTKEFQAVRLARSHLGGFEAIEHMEGEEVKLNESDGNWSLVIPERDERNLSSGRIYAGLVLVLFSASILGFVIPFALAFLYPYGVQVLSLSQGVSLMLASIVLFSVSLFGLQD